MCLWAASACVDLNGNHGRNQAVVMLASASSERGGTEAKCGGAATWGRLARANCFHLILCAAPTTANSEPCQCTVSNAILHCAFSPKRQDPAWPLQAVVGISPWVAQAPFPLDSHHCRKITASLSHHLFTCTGPCKASNDHLNYNTCMRCTRPPSNQKKFR